MVRMIPLLLLFALAACSKGAPAPEAGSSASGTMPSAAVASDAAASAAAQVAAAAATKPVPAELPAVVARVNGEAIDRTEFEKAVKTIEEQAGQPVPPTERDRIYRRILDDLIKYHLLMQESRSRKVAVPDAEIEAQVNSVRSRFPSEDAFKKMLVDQKITLDQVRADMRADMSVNMMLRAEIEPKIVVTSDEVSAFYKGNPDKFLVPDQVRAAHILISVPESADATIKAAALAKANLVLKSARSGKDFAGLAKQHSQDPGTAQNGGDLGMFAPGQMVGPFNEVAFRLPPGSISDVVETQFGYHIIKVLEKQPGRSVSLEEAKPRIEDYLQGLSREKHKQAFVQALYAKGKIDVYI